MWAIRLKNINKGREPPDGAAGNEQRAPCRVQSIACVQQSVHSVCAQILLLSHYTLPCFCNVSDVTGAFFFDF